MGRSRAPGPRPRRPARRCPYRAAGLRLGRCPRPNRADAKGPYRLGPLALSRAAMRPVATATDSCRAGATRRPKRARDCRVADCGPATNRRPRRSRSFWRKDGKQGRLLAWRILRCSKNSRGESRLGHAGPNHARGRQGRRRSPRSREPEPIGGRSSAIAARACLPRAGGWPFGVAYRAECFARVRGRFAIGSRLVQSYKSQSSSCPSGCTIFRLSSMRQPFSVLARL